MNSQFVISIRPSVDLRHAWKYLITTFEMASLPPSRLSWVSGHWIISIADPPTPPVMIGPWKDSNSRAMHCRKGLGIVLAVLNFETLKHLVGLFRQAASLQHLAMTFPLVKFTFPQRSRPLSSALRLICTKSLHCMICKWGTVSGNRACQILPFRGFS